MASWISEDGIFFPANERVSLKNETEETIKNPSMEGSRFFNEDVEPGQDYIYEGPCRDAMKYVKEMGQEDLGYIGQHFTNNNDMVELARMKYNKTVEEYAKMHGYDEDKAKAVVKKYREKTINHAPAQKVKSINPSGGGTNTTGSGTPDKTGGFGAQPELN